MIKRVKMPDSNYDLTDRTTAEDIWLWRHRQESQWGPARGRRGGSMAQAEAAELIGISAIQYIKLENGETTLMSLDDITSLRNWPLLRDPLGGVLPSPGELCFLARRRSGRPVGSVAADLHVSTQTYGKLESAGDPRVRAYWMRQGYRFPPLSRPTAPETPQEAATAPEPPRAVQPPPELRKRVSGLPAPPQTRLELSRPSA